MNIINPLNKPVDYLGIADFDETNNPSDNGEVRLDHIMEMAGENSLTEEQTSNLFANTVTHEIGHLQGLGHNNNPSDVMHEGSHANDWDYPPNLTVEQIQSANTNAVLANSEQLEISNSELLDDTTGINFSIPDDSSSMGEGDLLDTDLFV